MRLKRKGVSTKKRKRITGAIRPIKRHDFPVNSKSKKAKAKEKRKLKCILPKLKPGWKRYIDSGPVERIAYTFRIEAVVEMRGNYQMSFRPEQYEGLKTAKGAAAIQYLHTQFLPTIPEAVIDLREKVAIINAYGGVTWLSVDLYKVSGDGPLREKHWQLLGEYDEPEDVPGF